MFRNIEAEQKRLGKTNAEMAEILNVSRVTYESKKKTGSFSAKQAYTLCKLFGCSFNYLFDGFDMDDARTHHSCEHRDIA
jgi:DNA-binding XRE family transcriptional regulator